MKKIFYSDNVNSSLFLKDNNYEYFNPLSSKKRKKNKAVEIKKRKKNSKNKISNLKYVNETKEKQKKYNLTFQYEK